ncbi:MAG TPA: hypothetical protein VJA18_06330 [Candidatus Nanoarchaeia archaeon]|nr:hypothetical protein [Candidatus Nanoarchaeia archaeon]
MKHTIVALLDRPSTDSFAMNALVVQNDQTDLYKTTGLVRNRTLTPKEVEDLYGHILRVSLPLPENLVNPAAVWIGDKFYAKAQELDAPALPDTTTWSRPLEPYMHEGKYSIKSAADTYKTLEQWTIAAAREALVRNSHDLAVLAGWTLTMHPATKAALYFTTTDRRSELELQLRIEWDKKKTRDDLIREHEAVRSALLQR